MPPRSVHRPNWIWPVFVGALSMVSSVSCRGRTDGGAPSPPAPPVRGGSASYLGPDRLAPGEAPPGVERAYDLLLPRGSVVERRFGASVHARVPLSAEDTANWVRRQAPDHEALMGPEGTVFTKVRVTGAPADHHLRVEIARSSAGTLVTIERVEVRPPPPMGDNAGAMKKVGLTPDGKLLDPTHTE